MRVRWLPEQLACNDGEDKVPLAVIAHWMECAGGQAEFLIAAKDAKGVRKSLGGDVFTVSWTSAGRQETPMTGLVRLGATPVPLCTSEQGLRSVDWLFTSPTTSQPWPS